MTIAKLRQSRRVNNSPSAASLTVSPLPCIGRRRRDDSQLRTIGRTIPILTTARPPGKAWPTSDAEMRFTTDSTDISRSPGPHRAVHYVSRRSLMGNVRRLASRNPAYPATQSRLEFQVLSTDGATLEPNNDFTHLTHSENRRFWSEHDFTVLS